MKVASISAETVSCRIMSVHINNSDYAVYKIKPVHFGVNVFSEK